MALKSLQKGFAVQKGFHRSSYLLYRILILEIKFAGNRNGISEDPD